MEASGARRRLIGAFSNPFFGAQADARARGPGPGRVGFRGASAYAGGYNSRIVTYNPNGRLCRTMPVRTVLRVFVRVVSLLLQVVRVSLGMEPVGSQLVGLSSPDAPALEATTAALGALSSVSARRPPRR